MPASLPASSSLELGVAVGGSLLRLNGQLAAVRNDHLRPTQGTVRLTTSWGEAVGWSPSPARACGGRAGVPAPGISWLRQRCVLHRVHCAVNGQQGMRCVRALLLLQREPACQHNRSIPTLLLVLPLWLPSASTLYTTSRPSMTLPNTTWRLQMGEHSRRQRGVAGTSSASSRARRWQSSWC